MNEEAMTSDKEQVVEPLTPEEEAIARRTHRPTSRTVPFIWVESGEKDERVETSCARCEEEWPCGASRLLATLDAERGDRERQFREWKAAQDISVAEWQRQIDAARTASVTGLDRYYRAEPLGDDDDGWVVCRGADRVLVVADEAEASRVVSGLNADLFHAVPSIEQEPGEHRLLFPPHPDGFHVSSALCSCGDWQYDHDTTESLLAAQQDVRRDHVAHIRAALREQEPGEAEYDGHSFYEDPVQGFAGECDYSYRNGERCGHDAAFHWHEREQEPGETLRAARDE